VIPATRFDERQIGQAAFWALHHLMPPAAALVYAAMLARLPLEAFLDRANYLIYAEYSDLIIARFLSLGPLAALANEPLWLFVNIALAQVFPAQTGLRILIFVPAFVVAFVLLRQDPRHGIWIALLLVMPQVMKNHVIHLRQGLGLSVFLLGFFTLSPWPRRALMLMAGLVHSSFLFLALILALASGLRATPLSARFRVVLMVVLFATAATFVDTVAQAFGARQALQYADARAELSGLGFLFWLVIAGLFLSAERGFLEAQMPALAIVVFYLSTYFILPYAARIFESGLVLVFLAGLNLPGARRHVFIVAALCYGALMVATPAASPWFGWALGG